ncbi:MAG TPA: Mur ligase family protein [Candidatus Saccharimonadales bacterium]|nr:Mur ligase family protein [Candidatus Saccharimonadales bacterium]
MKIDSIAEAEKILRSYAPSYGLQAPNDTTLDRIIPLMEHLGNPQEQIKIVHVAGTSGKTSTVYYVAALLAASGQQVGLTVSPHVDSITERIQINGQPISEQEFCQKLGEFLDIVNDQPVQPSYFELMYAFAIWVLAGKNIDYAVIETGVGGLHDATNIIQRRDKVCVITDIGFDHMHLLGNTLPEIAAQKIGIAHPGNQVFCYRPKDQAVLQVFEDWTSKHDATLNIVEESVIQQNHFRAGLPDYQQRNWSLAKRTYDYLAERDSLRNLTSEELLQTQDLQVPGRMDIKKVGNKQIVMDGAHNYQKMAMFVDSFHKLYPDAKPPVLIALKQGKEYEELAGLLAGFASSIIVTTFEVSQDAPTKSLEPEVLAEALKQAGAAGVRVISNSEEALRELLDRTQDVGVVTGSFYLLSQLRKSKLLA